MSTPNQYFGRGTHMSAVLKRDIHRVRAARPDFLKTVKFRESSMDSDGKVTVVDRKDVRSTPMSPKARHILSTQRERY